MGGGTDVEPIVSWDNRGVGGAAAHVGSVKDMHLDSGGEDNDLSVGVHDKDFVVGDGGGSVELVGFWEVGSPENTTVIGIKTGKGLFLSGENEKLVISDGGSRAIGGSFIEFPNRFGFLAFDLKGEERAISWSTEKDFVFEGDGGGYDAEVGAPVFVVSRPAPVFCAGCRVIGGDLIGSEGEDFGLGVLSVGERSGVGFFGFVSGFGRLVAFPDFSAGFRIEAEEVGIVGAVKGLDVKALLKKEGTGGVG